MDRKAQIPKAQRRTAPRRAAGKNLTYVGLNDSPYDHDEIEFMLAVDQYKRDNKRPFPSSSEVLLVLKSLGYRKVEEKGPLPRMPILGPSPGG